MDASSRLKASLISSIAKFSMPEIKALLIRNSPLFAPAIRTESIL